MFERNVHVVFQSSFKLEGEILKIIKKEEIRASLYILQVKTK